MSMWTTDRPPVAARGAAAVENAGSALKTGVVVVSAVPLSLAAVTIVVLSVVVAAVLILVIAAMVILAAKVAVVAASGLVSLTPRSRPVRPS